jgi:hypothetical protein
VGRAYAIGDGGGLQFRKRVDELMKRIDKHGAGLKPTKSEDGEFEYAVEQSHHRDAKRKGVEELALNESSFYR